MYWHAYCLLLSAQVSTACSEGWTFRTAGSLYNHTPHSKRLFHSSTTAALPHGCCFAPCGTYNLSCNSWAWIEGLNRFVYSSSITAMCQALRPWRTQNATLIYALAALAITIKQHPPLKTQSSRVTKLLRRTLFFQKRVCLSWFLDLYLDEFGHIWACCSMFLK